MAGIAAIVFFYKTCEVLIQLPKQKNNGIIRLASYALALAISIYLYQYPALLILPIIAFAFVILGIYKLYHATNTLYQEQIKKYK